MAHNYHLRNIPPDLWARLNSIREQIRIPVKRDWRKPGATDRPAFMTEIILLALERFADELDTDENS